LKLLGLGLYLAFDDPAHMVTAIYLLDQQPYARKFQTIEEYQQLRDSFLKTCFACIRMDQQLQAWVLKK
jgi:hypothetical protein